MIYRLLSAQKKLRERESWVPEEKTQGTPFKTSVKETSDTCLKLPPEDNMREIPRRIQRVSEASREDALASTQQFFTTVHERSRGANVEGPIVTSSDRNENDIPIASNIPTTPDIPETEATETEARSPRPFLPSGSPPRPTATATCRPRMWVQYISEGQINEPTPDDAHSSESASHRDICIYRGGTRRIRSRMEDFTSIQDTRCMISHRCYPT